MTSLADDLQARTKRFALAVVQFFRVLPHHEEARVIGRQLLRSGTSVAANYRAVRRARSRAEFIAKIGIVVEEIDESVFWLELLADSGIGVRSALDGLLKESHELLAIFTATQRTARPRRSS